jgi:coenzyme F420-0:L-glutamate ligase/coenzyme F420-1:gamma-L-glutamate ligase
MTVNGPEMLEWMRTRRSVRTFADRPIEKDVLERVLEAATTAPSSSNRQPWKWSVITAPSIKSAIVAAIEQRATEIKAIIARGHHAEDYGSYGDFFYEPLRDAAAIVVPQYRPYPDLIANLIASGGGDPAQYTTAGAMQAELVSTSAAIMALLLQAHAEGLGACMMAGPMIAKDQIHALLGIAQPWQMVGAIALGHRAEPLPSNMPRKPIDRVVTWHEETP